MCCRGAGLLAQQCAGEGQRDLCVAVIQIAYLWDVCVREQYFASPAGKRRRCFAPTHLSNLMVTTLAEQKNPADRGSGLKPVEDIGAKIRDPYHRKRGRVRIQRAQVQVLVPACLRTACFTGQSVVSPESLKASPRPQRRMVGSIPTDSMAKAPVSHGSWEMGEPFCPPEGPVM